MTENCRCRKDLSFLRIAIKDLFQTDATDLENLGIHQVGRSLVKYIMVDEVELYFDFELWQAGDVKLRIRQAKIYFQSHRGKAGNDLSFFTTRSSPILFPPIVKS